LTGDTRPTLAEHRNTLAHGDPFEGLPTGGLLELVRDLINFAYRDYIAEAPRPEFLASTVMSTTDFIGATKWVES
jgi:hypothetical protein